MGFMDVLFLLETRSLDSDIMFSFLNFVGMTQPTTELISGVHLALLMSSSLHRKVHVIFTTLSFNKPPV